MLYTERERKQKLWEEEAGDSEAACPAAIYRGIKRVSLQTARTQWGLTRGHPPLCLHFQGEVCAVQNMCVRWGPKSLSLLLRWEGAAGRGSSSPGVSPHQVGKMKARAGGSRPGQMPWGINRPKASLGKGTSGLGRGLLRREGGKLGGWQQERPRRESDRGRAGGTALEIPSARACSLGHIPAATSLSPCLPSSHFLIPLP